MNSQNRPNGRLRWPNASRRVPPPPSGKGYAPAVEDRKHAEQKKAA